MSEENMDNMVEENLNETGMPDSDAATDTSEYDLDKQMNRALGKQQQ